MQLVEGRADALAAREAQRLERAAQQVCSASFSVQSLHAAGQLQAVHEVLLTLSTSSYKMQLTRVPLVHAG